MSRNLFAFALMLWLVSGASAQQTLKLPVSWKLPAMEETSKLKLLELPGRPDDPLALSIRSETAELPKNAVIVTEPAPDRMSWLVKAIDDPAAKAPRTVNLATITRDGVSLYMAWSLPAASPVLRRQVTNCQLDLRVGAISDVNAIRGTVQLREPVIKPELVLDLREQQQTVEFELTDLPRQKAIRLEIRELFGFGAGTKVREDSKSVGIGKRATIELTELPGAEIRAIMQPLKSGSGVAVSFKAVFREKKGEWDLNLPALENLVETAKQTFDNVVGRGFSIKYPQSGSQLEEAIDVVEKIDEELARLNRNRPTDITQVSVWERTHSALVPQLRAANKRVDSLTALAFECEARIKAAPKVKEALQRLDGRATISFTICAETGGQTNILLAAASGTGRDY